MTEGLSILCVIITHMATKDTHLAQYRAFKQTADLPGASPQGRVEMLFLAAYHLIDACAARKNVHIDKHQRVRHELEANPVIFGERTGDIWSAFQEIETRLRPKFVYGSSWRKKDLEAVLEKFSFIETVCLEVLG